MVPKLHKKGRSFKGAARYLLHDKGADTDDRVAWAETRNLAVEDPHVGWRLMAATAMDQARLKEQAGVKNTGRKSDLHALHFSLSWHEDEADGLDRPAMLAAAEAAIGALKAKDRQAIIVCHDDEAHPHVHILLNRVSQEDGRMLSSSKEKLNLSAWAEQYEKDRGKIWCDERVINNEARRRGEYTRGVPSKARHLHEADQRRAANDNQGEEARAVQRRKDAALAEAGREKKRRQAEAWKRLERQHKQRSEVVREQTRLAIGRGRDQVRKDFRPRWATFHHEKEAAMRAFEQREATLLGRITNRVRGIDLKRIVGGEDKRGAIGEAFNAVTSKAARLEAEQRRHRAEEQRLKREQRQAEVEAVRELREREKSRLAENRRRFQAERMQVALEHRMQNAKHRAQWLERNKQRDAAMPRSVEPGCDRGQSPPHRPAAAEQDNKPPTQAGDLLPREGADERARQIEAFRQQQAEWAERRQQNKADRGREEQDRDRD